MSPQLNITLQYITRNNTDTNTNTDTDVIVINPYSIKSNQLNQSNQFKSNQIKSNQIKLKLNYIY